MERTRICRTNEFGSLRSAMNLAPITKLSLFPPRNIFRSIGTGKIQNLVMRGSHSRPCSKTFNGWRKATQKLVCTVPKKWQPLGPTSSQDTGASCGPRHKIRGGTETPGCRIQVSFFPPDTSSDRAIIAWTVRQGWRNFHFQGTLEKNKILNKTILASNFTMYSHLNLPVVWHWKSGTYTEKSKSISIPSNWHWLRHNTLIRRAFEGAVCARSVENWQLYIINESVMNGNSSTLLGAENTQSQGILKIRDYKQFLTAGIEVFESAEIFVKELPVPSRQAGNSKSWVCKIARNWKIRTTISSCRGWPPKFWSTGNRWTSGQTKKLRQSQIFCPLFQSMSLRINPRKSTNQKRLWIREHLQVCHEDPATYRVSWIRRSSTMGSCFSQACQVLSTLRMGTRNNWFALSQRHSHTFVLYKDTFHGVTINPTLFSLFEILFELGRTHVPHVQLFTMYTSIL